MMIENPQGCPYEIHALVISSADLIDFTAAKKSVFMQAGNEFNLKGKDLD